MARRKETKAIAVTAAAWLAGRALARLEAAAAEVHEAETNKRALRLLSTEGGFSAVIKHGKTLIEISGSDFAVTQSD